MLPICTCLFRRGTSVMFQKTPQIRALSPFIRKTAPINIPGTSSHSSLAQVRYSHRPNLGLSRSLRIAAHDFDLLSMDRVLVVKLEVDVFNQKSPYFIAEPVGIQMTLSAKHYQLQLQRSEPMCTHTLKFRRALTLSARTSVTHLSKLAMTFMASCGSMRPE